jgi:hypothetical protein
METENQSEIQRLLHELAKLRDDPDSSREFLEADLVAYVSEHWDRHLSKTADDLYSSLPPELQRNANQQIYNYAIGLEQVAAPESLKLLDGLLLVQACQSEQAPEDGLSPAEIEAAFRAMAQELSDYYGRRDSDDDAPCWPP